MSAAADPFVLAGIALVCLALRALIIAPGALRRIIALNVIGSGIFLVLVAAAGRGGGEPDPVPHALVLTGIVVAVATSALAIGLARRLHRVRARDEGGGEA